MMWNTCGTTQETGSAYFRVTQNVHVKQTTERVSCKRVTCATVEHHMKRNSRKDEHNPHMKLMKRGILLRGKGDEHETTSLPEPSPPKKTGPSATKLIAL